MQDTCFYCGKYIFSTHKAMGITCCSRGHLIFALVALRSRIDRELDKLDEEEK